MELLRDFFARSVDFDSGLLLFGSLHILITAVFLVLGASIVIFRRRLRSFGHFGAIRRSMAWVLLVNMIIHYLGRILIGEWCFSEDLPLHICFAANFFMVYILFTDNRRFLFSWIYYFTMIGPLPAVIFPDISRSQSGYLFWQFVISHHVMLLFGLYCAFVFEYGTSLTDAARAFVFGNAYVAAAAVFNRVFGTNYIMLGGLPQQLYRLFPFLNVLPAFVWLESVGILALIGAYALWAAIKKHPPLQKRQAHSN